MISQTITVNIENGIAPFEYYISSDSSCISFDNPAGSVSTDFITVTAMSNNDQCFDTTTSIMHVVSSDGCKQTIELPLVNPCDNFVLDNVVKVENYKFTAQATSTGCNKVNFVWNYNNNLFNQVDLFNGNYTSILTLEPKERNSFPDTSSVYVEASDCNDCVKVSTLTFDICRPIADTESIFLSCVDGPLGGNMFTSQLYRFSTSGNCSSNIDWSTIEMTLPNNITYNILGFNSDQFAFIGSQSLSAGNYTGEWTVRNEYGIKSTTGLINIVVQDCNDNQTIGIVDRSIQLDCSEVSAGDTIEIDIEDSLSLAPNTTVDWTTWELLPVPSPVSSSITVGVNGVGRRVINYEVPNPIVPDVFSWTVCDTNGNCADAAVYTIVNCLGSQTAVDDSDCAICGQPVTIDVLANDTSEGPINLGSVSIVTVPTNGTVITNSDGTITYTPNSNFEGTDTFGYTFRNTQGVYSNEATVTVTVICAGDDSTVAICNN